MPRIVFAGIDTDFYLYFYRVLMLRRKASPTHTELHINYSHMVNEALEMTPLECHPEGTSRGFTPSISTDA